MSSTSEELNVERLQEAVDAVREEEAAYMELPQMETDPREELVMLAVQNPDILKKEINRDLREQVNAMDIEEVRMRVKLAHQFITDQVDKVVTEAVIRGLNMLVGRILGCPEELNASTGKDQALMLMTRQMLQLNILNAFSPNIKLLLQYIQHPAALYLNGTVGSKCSASEDDGQLHDDSGGKTASR